MNISFQYFLQDAKNGEWWYMPSDTDFWFERPIIILWCDPVGGTLGRPGGTRNVDLSSSQVINLQNDKSLGLHDLSYKMEAKISQLIYSCGLLGRTNIIMDVALVRKV